MTARRENAEARTLGNRKRAMIIATVLVCSLIALIGALLVLGAYAPSIPYLGIFGSVALSLFPGWLLLVPALMAGALWYLTSGWSRVLLVTPTLLAVIGAAVVLGSLVNLARANGVALTIGDAFGMGGNWRKPTSDETAEYVRDLGDALTVQIYRPSGTPPAGGWPVLMYVHGGGWVEGDNTARSADWRWFADRGWMVVSAGYSLSGDERHLWDRVVPQIGCAMAWTAANVGSRGGNPDRFALIGESAGGNLVLNAAYMAEAGKLTPVCRGNLPPVRAVTAIYPGVDLSRIASRDPLLRDTLKRMIGGYTGGPFEQYPERFRQVASATHIHESAPPTLVYISENDHLVPSATMHEFVKSARQGGIDVRSVSVPFAEHGFDALGIGNQIVRQTTLTFLNDHI